MFSDSKPYLGLGDSLTDKEFYQMMEKCISKGKPMKELYPYYTINWDDYDEGDFID